MFSLMSFFHDMLFFAAYVSISSSFPDALPKAEEEKLIDLYCTTRDQGARTKLIEHNLRLVAHIARKYVRTGADLDELISVGSIGLMKAIGTFVKDKGQLSNYASRCIENEILMFLRSERKHSAFETSFEDPIGHDSDGNEVTLGDRLYSDDNVEEQVENSCLHKAIISAAEAVLDDREKKVVFWRYRIDCPCSLTQQQIADRLGVSRSYISRIEKKALKKLRRELINSNCIPD